MAPWTSDFDVTSKVISIRCTGSNVTCNVHEDLLEQLSASAPFSAAKKDGAIWELDLPHDGFKHFAHWLYQGELDVRGDDREKTMLELISAHEVGRKMCCVRFQDLVIDGIIDNLRDIYNDVWLGMFLSQWLQEFPSGSLGRQLLLDWLMYSETNSIRIIDGSGNGNSSAYSTLTATGDSDFVKTFARQILLVLGKTDFAQMADDEDTSIMTILGFMNKQAEGGFEKLGEQAWKRNLCEYHHHTKLRQPCYKAE
ncbi:hypothetical protein LTR37_011241 [Vermiconidia calcicola]|uniref:Uncharacterized protein n=1 Tax=Vermiconidia calcicola TaxID=1690605 RepID=A0ACC3N2R9_9PEZI|nr:hypothetical protein LTR37_011241 [Vermiconidia calcicola]